MANTHQRDSLGVMSLATTSTCPRHYKLSIDEECEYTVEFFDSIVAHPTITLTSFMHTKANGDDHLHYDYVQDGRRIGGGCVTLSSEEVKEFHSAPIKWVEDYIASFD